MKLVRFSNGNGERLGAICGETVLDLAKALTVVGGNSDLIPQSMRAFLSCGSASMDAAQTAVSFAEKRPDGAYCAPLSSVTLLPPVGDPQKIICVGQNYRDHCAEQNQPLPERAIIFSKFPSALIGPK